MPHLKEMKEEVCRWKLKFGWQVGERHESTFVIKVFNSRDTSVTPELKGSIHNRWFETTIVGYWGMDIEGCFRPKCFLNCIHILSDWMTTGLTLMSVADIGSWEHNHDYNEDLEEENSTWTQAGWLAVVSTVQYRSFWMLAAQ